MAERKATFIVDVVTKGLKAARDQVAGIGREARIASQSYTGADKTQRDFYDTQKKGIIGTANSTKSFSKLAETMNSSSGVVGAYATLAANIFAVTAAFNALRSAAQVNQVQQGLEAMSNRMGTTLSVAADNVREISGYTLTVEQSLRSTAQIASAGFGTKSIEDLGKAANDVSFALGRNMTDSMDRLTRGVIKLEPELLDELGLMTKLGESSSRYAAELGKTESQLSNFEKRQGFLNAILTEAETKFGGLADEAGNTRNLDRLGATFADLTKDIFNFINQGALPLAGILSNKGILLGGMLLFASTISKQLLPGLTNLQIKAAQTAISLKEVSAANITAIPTDRREPRGVKQLRRDIDNDKASLESYQRALDSIDRKEADYIKKLDASDRGRRKLSAEKIASIREEMGILEDQRTIISNTMNLERQASAQTLAANSIAAAGQKRLLVSYHLINAAVKEYAVAVGAATMANGKFVATGSAVATMKTAWFAAATGARAFGAAVVSAFGAIGIAVAIIWSLIEALKWLRDYFKDKDLKEYEKQWEDFATILNQVGDRYTEVNRVLNSNIPVAQKQLQVYTTMTNTVRENVEAYEKLKVAQDALYKDRNKIAAGESAEITTLRVLRGSGLPELRQQIDDALGKRGLRGALEDADRVFSKSEIRNLSEILTEDLRGGAATLGDHIKDLSQAGTEANRAISELNRNLIPSTPYDEVAKQMDSVANSFGNIIANAATSENFANRITQSMLGMGTQMRGFFSIGLQTDLKTFEEVDQKMADLRGKTDAASLKEYRAAQATKESLSESIALRANEVFQMQEVIAKAQQLSIETKAQMTMEQARLKQLNSFRALSGSTIKLRIGLENNIIELQKNQIRAQIKIVELQAEMLRQQKLVNEAALISEKAYGRIADKIGEAAMSNMGAVTSAVVEELQTINKELRGVDRNSARGRELIQQQEQLRELYGSVAEIQAQTQALRGAEVQTNSANLEIQALSMGQTSQLVANAEAQAVSAKTVADTTKKNLETAKALVNIETQRANIARLTAGRAKSTVEEYNELVNLQNRTSILEKAALKDDAAATIAELRTERARASEQGLTAEVALYDERIAQEIRLANARMVELDQQNQLNILEKFSFDIHKEGLNMQRESLNYLEKQLDVYSDFVAAQREGRNLTADIARRRSGQGDNEFLSRSREIEEAREQLNIARQQASMRKAVISLEYALLEAQRQQTIWNLEAQKEILGANTEQGKQLDVVIRNLKEGAGAIADAQSMATAAVDQNISNLAKKLELLGLNERGGTQSMLRDFVALRQAQAGAVAVGQRAQIAPIVDAMETHISPLTKSNETLISATNRSAAATEALVKELTTSANAPMSTRPAGNIHDYAAQARAAGLTVREIGAQTGHKGLGHRQWRAFDASIAPGNADSTNPRLRAQMDAMAKRFVDQGLIVLWNGQRLSASGNRALTKGEGMHRDHMHVEIPANAARVVGTAVGTTIAPPLIEAAQPPLQAATEAAVKAGEASDAVKAANDNKPIVVTGQRNQAPFAQNAENLIGAFDIISSKVNGNILQVFEEMADKLGPEGSIVPTIIAGLNNLGNAFINFQDVMTYVNPETGKGSSFADKFVAGAAVMQSALATIQSVLAAATDARVANIDREIAAEQKRDGKSAESVAKIQAMERKKDAIQRKAFNTQKKLMMAQAVIATASGVAMALGSLPPPASFILAGLVAALGAAQLAIIAGTQYQSSAGANFDQKTMPDTLSIGKRGDSVDVARHNTNIGGEISYLRGTRGTGTNASNYAPAVPLGSAYGGPIPRGYGNYAYVTGEKGPEYLQRDIPVNVSRPANDDMARPIQVQMDIHAWDGQSVSDMLYERRGEMIDMFREAANANGTRFLEDVKTQHYKKSNVGGVRKI